MTCGVPESLLRRSRFPATIQLEFDCICKVASEFSNGPAYITDRNVSILPDGKGFHEDIVMNLGLGFSRLWNVREKNHANADGIRFVSLDEVLGARSDGRAGNQPRAVQRGAHQIGIATVDDEPVRKHLQYSSANHAAALDAGRAHRFNMLRDGLALVGLGLNGLWLRSRLGEGGQGGDENEYSKLHKPCYYHRQEVSSSIPASAATFQRVTSL